MKTFLEQGVRFVLIVTTAVYLAFQLYNVIDRSTGTIRQLVSAHGDLNALKRLPYIHRVAMEAADVIPPAATVQVPFYLGGGDFRPVIFYYFLFPRVLKTPGDYVIDYNGTIREPPPGGAAVTLSTGTRVLASRGHGFLQPHSQSAFPLGLCLAVVALMSVYLSLVGGRILRIFKIGPDLLGGLWFWSTGYLLGFVFLSLVTWIYLMAGGPFSVSAVAALWVMSATALFAFGPQRTDPLTKSKEAPRQQMLPAGGLPVWAKAVNGLGVLVIALCLIRTVIIPISVWDEMLIWVFKARVLCFHGHLILPADAVTNNYYPLLWPVYLAVQFLFLGSSDLDSTAKWAMALMLGALFVQLRTAFGLLRLPKDLGWALAALFMLVFQHWTMFTALPETIMTALMMVMIVLGMLSLRTGDRRPFLALMIVTGVGVSGLKFEGYCLAFMVAFALWLASRGTRRWPLSERLLLAGLLLTPAVELIWILWLKAHQYGIDIYHFEHPFAMTNVGVVGGMFLYFLRDSRLMIFLFAVWGWLIVRRPARSLTADEIFLGCLAAALVLFDLGAGLRWPLEDLVYYPEVMARLFVRVGPPLILLLASLFGAESLPKKDNV